MSPSSVAVDDFNRDGKLDLAVANNRSDTVSVLLGNGDGTFQAAVSYPVGGCSQPPDQRSFPWSVATGDFDGDGKVDLAVATSGCHTVSVLWGNGDGTFQAARDFGAGISPVFVTMSDFNRDGKLDLVVANLFSGVSVLLGNGADRTFQAAVSYSTGTQSWSVAVGDFNGDQVPDLAVANFDSNNVSILRGLGDGTFQAAGTYAAGRQPRSVVMADFNGDGTSDLAVANFDTFNSDTNDVSVLLGKGDGTFPAPLNTPAGTGSLSWVHSISVATGDFNGDGKQDFAVANQDNSVSVLLGNGDGTFRVAGTFAAHLHPSSLAVGDFNRDGKLDLAVTNIDSNDVSVLLGNGDGTLQAASGATTLSVILDGAGTGTVTSSESPRRISCGTSCTASYTFNTPVTLTATPSAGSTFTGWRVLGAASCAGTGPCTVTITGTTFVWTTFAPAQGPPTITTQPASQTVTAGQTATFSVTATGTAPLGYQWQKTGVAISGAMAATYTTPTTTTADSGAQFTVVVTNGAGSVTSNPATLTVNVPRFTLTVSKTGNGTVTSSPAGISCGATCSTTYNSGTMVTLTAAPAGGSSFRGWSGGGCAGIGTCTVTLTANTTVSASFGTAGVSAPILMWQYGGCLSGPYCDTGSYASPAVVDLDGDGRPDVIWGDYDVVALNGADGSLKWRGASTKRILPSIAVADLNGDGTLEVIVARDLDELTVYDRFGNVMWRRNPFGSGNELRTLAVADLESDGRLEILVGRTGGQQAPQLIAFEPDGTVRPGWPVRHSGEPGYGWGLYYDNVAVADMNGDGFKEVFSPTTGHYITAVDPNGNQLGTNAMFDRISNAPVGPKVWSQVGIHVDQTADLRGYSICGTEHRPTFENSAPVVADVDGDGVPELIVVGNIYNCATNAGLYYMPFILKLDRTRWSGSGFDWTVLPTPGPGSAPRSENYNVINLAVASPAVADLDGDGLKEIIFPSYDGKMHAYWLDKTEHGNWPYTIPTSGASGDDFRFASEPVVADLDGDGHAEVIFTSWPKNAVNGVGQLHILDYLGRELYRVDLPAPSIGYTRNGGLGAPTIANIDGDPDLEVVVGTLSSGAVAYKLPNSANARILWGTGRGSYLRSGTAAPGQ